MKECDDPTTGKFSVNKLKPTPPTLISLGMSCQTAHQLARYSVEFPNDATFIKSPFDWLICPPSSAASWLDSGLEDFFVDDISTTKDHPFWEKYQFWFWHGFTKRIGDARELRISETGLRELKKLEHQRAEFRNLNPKTTQFFISNTQNNLAMDVFSSDEISLFHFTNESILELYQSLNTYFNAPIQLHVITTEERSDLNSINQVEVLILPKERSEWKGCDDSWNNMLNSLV